MPDADMRENRGANGAGELPPAVKPWWSARFTRCATDDVACGFFADLDVRGLSRNTLIAYGRAVEDLIAFAGPLQSVTLNAQIVHGFIAYLRAVRFRPRARKPTGARPLSPATIRQRLVGLRALAEHLVDAGASIGIRSLGEPCGASAGPMRPAGGEAWCHRPCVCRLYLTMQPGLV